MAKKVKRLTVALTLQVNVPADPRAQTASKSLTVTKSIALKRSGTAAGIGVPQSGVDICDTAEPFRRPKD